MTKKKVVLIRLDKIGDLICTLPVDQVLDESVYDITWVVQKGLGRILDLGQKRRKYIELDKQDVERSKQQLSDFLHQHHFDIAISFQCPWWTNFELFKARIKKRIGVLSQWHSFLFLNDGLRQRRSQSIKHEYEYNLDLIKKITGPLPEETSKNYFKFKKPTSSEVIHKYDLGSGEFVVVHPGMMGSALNWPQSKYIEYIYSQIDLGKHVVVTGTDTDQPYLLKISAEFENHPKVTWLQSKLNFEELLQVLYYAEKILAPSTGVAHLAASLDKNVHAIFSPVKVHHPTRWAPRGNHVQVYLPSVQCPGENKCLGRVCPHYYCMEMVKV